MLPSKEQRQTVLFSATFPSDIKALSKSALRPNYELVDTVGESEVQTAERVRMPLILLFRLAFIQAWEGNVIDGQQNCAQV